MSDNIDAARLSFILNELRLPTIKHLWPKFAERADKESWPAARFLAAIAEHEITERDRRRMERNLGEARLLPGKTLENFDFAAVPMISKAQVSAGMPRGPLRTAGLPFSERESMRFFIFKAANKQSVVN